MNIIIPEILSRKIFWFAQKLRTTPRLRARPVLLIARGAVKKNPHPSKGGSGGAPAPAGTAGEREWMYDVSQMNKQHILDEIRRTAKANGGVSLGHKRFAQETGIRYNDWFGKYWGRWGDAVREAGYAPNPLQGAFSDDVLVQKLIAFIRELGRFPGTGDLRLKKRSDSTFPNDKVFEGHFGRRAQLRKVVMEYCESHAGFDDVPPLCGSIVSNGGKQASTDDERPNEVVAGFVYLMKHGRHYKIGKTNATGRREYELAIQLPEKLRTVHVIKTDDPNGIEEYWHRRFGAKRGNGEWFELDAADVQAFRRRKFM